MLACTCSGPMSTLSKIYIFAINYKLVSNYCIVKYFSGKKFGELGLDCRKFAWKNLDELKSICIGDVIEIVKIGEKSWRIAVIRQSFYCQCFFTGTRMVAICIVISR